MCEVCTQGNRETATAVRCVRNILRPVFVGSVQPGTPSVRSTHNLPLSLAPRSRDSAFSDFYLRVILKAKNPHILEELRNGFRARDSSNIGGRTAQLMATCDVGILSAFGRAPFYTYAVKLGSFHVTLQRL